LLSWREIAALHDDFGCASDRLGWSHGFTRYGFNVVLAWLVACRLCSMLVTTTPAVSCWIVLHRASHHAAMSVPLFNEISADFAVDHCRVGRLPLF
jgi:hypothetical protein